MARRMGFRPDIERVPLFGLGCAGGVAGLSLAAKLARAQPGSTVLLVAIELCSLAFRLDLATKVNIVASALFADGAAACILRTGRAGIAEIEMSGQHQWPDTLDIMGWSVDPEGLGVILQRDLPSFTERNAAPALNAILSRAGLRREDIGRFAFHPGGKKVLQALERAIPLQQGELDHERDVLADYGNMSAPTALFVLQRVMAAGPPRRTLLSALGPGFSLNCVSLTAAA